MTKDEALRLALEALEMFCEHGAILRPIETRDAIKAALEAKDEPVACCNGYYKQGYEAGFSGQQHYIHALQEALAKQEQGEPVALKPCGYESKETKMCRKCGQVHAEAIWDTTPPQRKPLTDEEKYALCKRFPFNLTFDAIAAIEAAHGIKGEA